LALDLGPQLRKVPGVEEVLLNAFRHHMQQLPLCQSIAGTAKFPVSVVLAADVVSIGVDFAASDLPAPAPVLLDVGTAMHGGPTVPAEHQSGEQERATPFGGRRMLALVCQPALDCFKCLAVDQRFMCIGHNHPILFLVSEACLPALASRGLYFASYDLMVFSIMTPVPNHVATVKWTCKDLLNGRFVPEAAARSRNATLVQLPGQFSKARDVISIGPEQPLHDFNL
jgi:hypothetical protein